MTAMRNSLSLLMLAAAGPVLAQEAESPAARTPTDAEKIERKAEGVVRQPFKDVGLMRENPPQILIDAQRAPYSLAGLRGCSDYRREIGRLAEVLGPDIDETDDKGDPLPGRLAEAGAKSIVNALIPFRGLVREASGAAEADRRFRIMVAAGMARRGYLKGWAQARGCRL